MNLPKRKTRQKMGLRVSEIVRCPGHLKWVRGHECCASVNVHINCGGRIEAHHLQSFRAIEGGMGLKVGDDKTVPLCGSHHAMIHSVGQSAFEAVYQLKLEKTAADLWKASPHGVRYRQQQETS